MASSTALHANRDDSSFAATAPISSAVLHDKSLRATPAMVALRAALAAASRPCARIAAASWLVTIATASSSATVIRSSGRSIRRLWSGVTKE